MEKSMVVKERIIEATMSLLLESKGNTDEISTRAITKRAKVGTGMINYHFQKKENLIEISVERIFNKVIIPYKPDLTLAADNTDEWVRQGAKSKFDFLISNPAISRIFMLTDLKNPKVADNTMRSTELCNQSVEGIAASDKERFLLSFTFVSVMQALFLRKDLSKELFGYDINVKEQRDEVLDLLIDTLFGKVKHAQKGTE